MISKIPTRSEIPESDTWWRFEAHRALSGSLWGPERCSTFGLGASRTNQCSPNLQMDYLVLAIVDASVGISWLATGYITI